MINLNRRFTQGIDITVTYSAVVNDNAVTVISKNNAELVYSNDPSNSYSTNKLSEEETVYSAKIKINKYTGDNADGDSSKKLSGAKFVLYKEVEEEVESQTVTKKYYYLYTAAIGNTPANVDWISYDGEITENTEGLSAIATVFTTGNDGAAEIAGLKAGEYKLLEIKAPDGYNLLEKPTDVTISKLTDEQISGNDTTTLTVTANVKNESGSLLPGTGGMGTTMLTIGGLLLMGAGVILFLNKKRVAA